MISGPRKHIVYSAESPSGKKYVGLTGATLRDRIKGHSFDAKSKKYDVPFHRAIRKYGVENFKWVVLEECPDRPTAIEAEKLWIAKLETQNSKLGYNATSGGDGFVATPELKEKIRQTLKTYHSDPNTHLKHSRERGGAPVYAFKLNGEFVGRFESQALASEALKVGRPHLNAVIRGKKRHIKGYVFSFTNTFPNIINYLKPEKAVRAFENGKELGRWDNICECAKALGVSRGQIYWHLKYPERKKSHPYTFEVA